MRSTEYVSGVFQDTQKMIRVLLLWFLLYVDIFPRILMIQCFKTETTLFFSTHSLNRKRTESSLHPSIWKQLENMRGKKIYTKRKLKHTSYANGSRIHYLANLLIGASREEMVEIIKDSRLHPREESSLIQALGSKFEYDSMMFLLKHSLNPPNIYSYTLAIAAMAQSPSDFYREKAKETFRELKSYGLKPNSFAYTAYFMCFRNDPLALLRCIQQGNLMKKFHSIDMDDNRKEMFNVHTLSSAIQTCYACQKEIIFSDCYTSAKEIYIIMTTKENVTPNGKILTLLLGCARKSISSKKSSAQRDIDFDSAMKILYDFQSNWNVTDESYMAALGVCAAADDIIVSTKIFENMKKSFKMKVHHYDKYLSCLARVKGNDLVVSQVLESMKLNHLEPTLKTYNLVLKAFAESDNYHYARKLLDEMKSRNHLERQERTHSQNCHTYDSSNEACPNMSSYNTVLSICDNANDAFSLVQEMRLSRRSRPENKSVRPNELTYTYAISSCRKSEPPNYDLAKKLFNMAADDDGIEPNVYMYSALIWTAASCGNPRETQWLLKNMKENGCQPNKVSYDGVITSLIGNMLCEDETSNAFYQAKNLVRAVKLFEEMKNDNIIPSKTTYNRLANAISTLYIHTKNNNSERHRRNNMYKIKLLRRIFNIMTCDERCLNVGGPVLVALINTYANANEPEKAKQIFDSIVGDLDVHATSAMLYAYSKSKLEDSWKDACLLIERYVENRYAKTGLRESEYAEPALLSYAVIACAKKDKWEEAFNLLDQYYDYGTDQEIFEHRDCDESLATKSTLSVAALNAVAAACGRCGHPEVAISLLNNMESIYGVVPNVRTYRSVIIACNQAEKERKMRRHQSSINEDAIVGNGIDGISQIKAHKKNNKNKELELQWWECGLSLLRRMREENLKPDVQIYSSVISSCQAAGQWQRAIGVLQCMEKDDVANLFCQNAAIAACEKGGAWVEALELYERMKEHEIVRPNFVTLNTLLIALDNAGQIEMAESVYRDALYEGIFSPWKYESEPPRVKNDVTRDDTPGRISGKTRIMDLHQFSAPMARVAITNVMESLLSLKPSHDKAKDLIIIVGKGNGSDERKGPVLYSVVSRLFQSRYGITTIFDSKNSGRIRVPSPLLCDYVYRKSWRL